MQLQDRIDAHIAKHSAEKDRARPNLGKLYRFLARLFALVVNDARLVFRGFFPGLGNRSTMERHAAALFLPPATGESDEHMRMRLTSASFYLRYLGTRMALRTFLDTSFKGRYRIVELPKDAFTVGIDPADPRPAAQPGTPIGTGIIMRGEGLYIYVRGLTADESTAIAGYLEFNIPPDAGYRIFSEV